MKDKQLVERLLSLGSELLIKGDSEAAATCTFAAARLMDLPNSVEVLRHPSAKVPDAITYKGIPLTFREDF